MAAKGNPVVRVDAKAFDRFRRDMSRLKADLPKGVDGGLKDGADYVARLTRRNFGWSRRIPRTVKVVKTKQNSWTVQAGGASAPHTRPWDPSSGKAVRAPTWPRGSRSSWRWHVLPHRPGMHDALRTAQKKVTELVAASVDKTLEKVK
jgi:hypothetical protein